MLMDRPLDTAAEGGRVAVSRKTAASSMARDRTLAARSGRGSATVPSGAGRRGTARSGLVVAAGLLLLSLGVQAAGKRVEVAPAVLMLQEDGWVERDASAAAMQVNDGTAGEIGRKAKVIYLPSAPGDVAAVMRVRASAGRGSVYVHSDCAPQEETYVNDQTGGRKHSPECVRVYGPVSSRAVLAKYMADARAVLEQEHLTIASGTWLVSLWFANDNGSTLDIELLVDSELPQFGLAAGKPEAKTPENIPPQVAAWADALGRSARSSIRSFSGELTVPALQPATPAAR